MSVAEIYPEGFEPPEERRLRLSRELAELLVRRHEAELRLSEARNQMVAAGHSGDELSMQRRKDYEDRSRELTEVELALNDLFAYDGLQKSSSFSRANAEVAWHEKPTLYRRAYNVPEPEPIPAAPDYDFDDDLDGEWLDSGA